MSASRSRRLGALALILGLGAAAGRLLHTPPTPAFRPASPAATPLPSRLSATLLPRAAPTAHAATLAELPDGDLAAAWFAGSKEGAPDVALYLSRYHSPTGVWDTPRRIADRAGVEAATGRYVRKLGNPVLGVDGAGRLHLWFVSVAYGGWAGASLNHQVSPDGGQHWSPARRLVTGPFLNISTLVRTPPLAREQGAFALPAYHEFLRKHGEWLEIGPDGHLTDLARLPGRGPDGRDRPALQPAVAPTDQGLLALLRDAGPGPGRVLAARSGDGGAHWHALAPLPIPNPNASVALLRLQDGRLLLAANPQAQDRNQLALWLSPDQGATWQAALSLEKSPNGDDEFSYPALLQDRQGRIHVLYTWRRQTIKQVVLTPARLGPAPKGAQLPRGAAPALPLPAAPLVQTTPSAAAPGARP